MAGEVPWPQRSGPGSRPSCGRMGPMTALKAQLRGDLTAGATVSAYLIPQVLAYATVAGLSEYLWELEQPAHAVANAYFVAAINRVGMEHPWKIGEFYGRSYFCNPRGKIIAQASRDKDELLVADLDLDEIQKVRDTWQFYRDRRPESYGEITRTQNAASSEAAD